MPEVQPSSSKPESCEPSASMDASSTKHTPRLGASPLLTVDINAISDGSGKVSTDLTEDLPGRRGTSPGSLRSLAEIRSRRIQLGQLLRQALTEQLAAAESRGYSPRAKELLGMLNATDAGELYLNAGGFSGLRHIQRVLRSIRAERSQNVAFCISEGRAGAATLQFDGANDNAD